MVTSKSERERLSPAASRTFFNIMTRWSIRDEDARMLLGGMSNGPFYELKKKLDRVLDTDRLTRVSYLIGIFKALNILYSEKLADKWVQLPNDNPAFGGQTPLAYIMKGGLPAMRTVRRLLDARRGGGVTLPPTPPTSLVRQYDTHRLITGELTQQLLEAGFLGVVCPSVRKAGGYGDSALNYR